MKAQAASMLLAGTLLAGCSTSAELDNPFARGGGDRAQMAAFAASSTYPDRQASDDLPATALVNREQNTIQVINASDRAITDARVWVNGQFVTHIPTLPAHGSVTLDRSRFYDSTGRTLAGQATSADRVELQTADNFYRLQGPVFE